MKHPNAFRFLLGVRLVIAATIMQAASAVAATNDVGVLKIQIVDDAMCCKGCAKIAAQLYAAPGVTSVDIDLPNHTVVVTAKPSPKLTARTTVAGCRKGRGKPSKLATPKATYTLTRTGKLKARRAGHGWKILARRSRDELRGGDQKDRRSAVRCPRREEHRRRYGSADARG